VNDQLLTEWGFVALAWGIAAVVILIYVVSLLARGRALSRRVPPEDRRWL